MYSPPPRKMFLGLSRRYYSRHFLNGLLPAMLLVVLLIHHDYRILLGLAVAIAIHTGLYPYARFAYEDLAMCIFRTPVFTHPVLVSVVNALATLLCW
ncbi:hypothetical protein HZU77_017035, partial [Neisseriaceae bacterium TC5R-5]|nr:hypothetical protein [Neisseriaceae bacterium TC5R-5]